VLKKPSTLLNFKPDPIRQVILVSLAFVGIGIGYGVGYLLKADLISKSPEVQVHKRLNSNTPTKIARAKSSTVAKTVFPEQQESNDKPRAYEEVLPKDIVEYTVKTNPLIIKAKPYPIAKPNRFDKGSKTIKSLPTADQLFIYENTSRSRVPIEETAKKVTHWLKNALTVTLSNKPKIAIVLDDMGVDQRRSYIATQLNGPLTLSYLTYARDLAKQTHQARQAGHELMLHVPMEPSSPDIDPGPNVLLSGVPENEIISTLNWGLDQFSGFVGINNHMGSRFTSNLEGMLTVMRELKKRKLIFLDSVTSKSTKGRIAANQIGVPFIARDIFLDHIDDVNEIKLQLDAVKRLAKKQGYAIAIGHPRDATIKVLNSWLAEIENENFQLVPISALIPLAYIPQKSEIITTEQKAFYP
jgi:polysaccharide deacetylase 2 family uncharacterized protein YibQ